MRELDRPSVASQIIDLLCGFVTLPMFVYNEHQRLFDEIVENLEMCHFRSLLVGSN